MSSITCVPSLVDMPDDILAMVRSSLSPRELCSVGLCCKSLNTLMASDEIWLTHCEMVGVVPLEGLVEWRKGVLSYKALCRFLTSVKPLVGVWVQQNPELGNVVYVMPGFVSVVGCRIIPQKLGPLSGGESPFLWVPVFEVIGDYNGSAIFTLHGRENRRNYIYPGSVKSVEKTCNVLLLEVEPEKENVLTVPFNKLSSDVQKKLLKIVTRQVRMKIPGSDCSPLFPCMRDDEGNFQRDTMLLTERRSLLIGMHKLGGDQRIDWLASHELMSSSSKSETDTDEDAQLHNFLSSGDIGLTLHASTMELDTYQTWPYMDKNLHALYKLPIGEPSLGQEYAGLWAGNFGWPPSRYKALYLLVLSYFEMSPGQERLIATQILQGRGHIRNLNGSVMFIVDVDKPPVDSFPWNMDGDSLPLKAELAFSGEGIASGYGFWGPLSQPVSLFVLNDGMLAFLWTETRDIFTLQRVNLEDHLKKSKRTPAPPPITNFSYLEGSYTEVILD